MRIGNSTERPIGFSWSSYLFHQLINYEFKYWSKCSLCIGDWGNPACSNWLWGGQKVVSLVSGSPKRVSICHWQDSLDLNPIECMLKEKYSFIEWYVPYFNHQGKKNTYIISYRKNKTNKECAWEILNEKMRTTWKFLPLSVFLMVRPQNHLLNRQTPRTCVFFFIKRKTRLIGVTTLWVLFQWQGTLTHCCGLASTRYKEKVSVSNLTSNWIDGVAFNALLHSFK